ncbi:hypothetical protein [Nonomuraea sediminis]|uniref:hypothetical protein n=1 Tax=Nonomuraea sediminis TaxID=2835864 RepID=UPI001BDBCA12|nr:hypothetical protein [Nonomuraea sediminis]
MEKIVISENVSLDGVIVDVGRPAPPWGHRPPPRAPHYARRVEALDPTADPPGSGSLPMAGMDDQRQGGRKITQLIRTHANITATSKGHRQ